MNGDHHVQTVTATINCQGLDSTEATGPDYDEIKDDRHQCAKESSGQLLAPGEKSVEEGHDYHTLMPGGEQVSTSKLKVIGFFECVCMLLTINFPSDTSAVGESGSQ